MMKRMANRKQSPGLRDRSRDDGSVSRIVEADPKHRPLKRILPIYF